MKFYSNNIPCAIKAVVITLSFGVCCADLSGFDDLSWYPFGNNLTYPEPIRLALTLPLTSRHGPDSGSIEQKVSALRFFSSFLPSFLETAILSKNSTDYFPCTYEFWIGYDRGDPVLDDAEGQRLFTEQFMSAVSNFEKSTFCGSIEPPTVKSCVSVKMLPFNYTNTLTALWNGLNAEAYQVSPQCA